MHTYHRYTVVTHPTGCKIIEGDSCPVSDFAALLTAWAKRGEADDPMICSTDLPKALNARSAVNVIAVVGLVSELDELSATIPSPDNILPTAALMCLLALFPASDQPGVSFAMINRLALENLGVSYESVSRLTPLLEKAAWAVVTPDQKPESGMIFASYRRTPLGDLRVAEHLNKLERDLVAATK
jgi:hypothetical protein